MEQSILISTRKMLQIGENDDSFDLDIITHINDAFSTLNDIGIGPEAGFAIADSTSKWENFVSLDDVIQLSRVRTAVYRMVRLAFDPPTLPPLLTSLENQLAEVLWRLNVKREETDWADPNPAPVVEEDEL